MEFIGRNVTNTVQCPDITISRRPKLVTSVNDRLPGLRSWAAVLAEGIDKARFRLARPAAATVIRTAHAAAGDRGGSAALSAPFGLSVSLPAIASARVLPYGFMLSTIELGIRIVAPRSLVVS